MAKEKGSGGRGRFQLEESDEEVIGQGDPAESISESVCDGGTAEGEVERSMHQPRSEQGGTKERRPGGK